MGVYQLDDFKRLSWLAKELATLKSDDPDLATTLKKCVTAGVSLAIFQHTPINVWRLSENRRTGNSKSEHVALPISDRGDLEEYEGVLFLTSSCIDALLNAGGEKIRCNKFGGGSSQKYAKAHDELILASERQVARSMVDEFLAQETRQQRKQKKAALVQTVFPDGGFEECSTEVWLEFSISDVLVLTRDIKRFLAVPPPSLSISTTVPTPKKTKEYANSSVKCLVSDLWNAYVKASQEKQPPGSIKQLLFWAENNPQQGYGVVKCDGKGNERFIQVSGKNYCRYSSFAGAFNRKKVQKSTNEAV